MEVPQVVTARIMPNIQVNTPSFPSTPTLSNGTAAAELDQNHFHVNEDDKLFINRHNSRRNSSSSSCAANIDYISSSQAAILNNNNTICQEPHRRSVSVSSYNGSLTSGSIANDTSPETEEFESLERRLTAELEEKLALRRESEHSRGGGRLSDEFNCSVNGSSDRKYSTATDLSDRDRKYSIFSDRKSSERKLSELSDVTGVDDDVSLQLVEKRQLRSFSRADEYLYAMKEDLAEWLNLLYPWLDLCVENFLERLETGEHLLRVLDELNECDPGKHANAVRKKHADIMERIERGEYNRKPPNFSVPPVDLPIRENVIPGTWFARDNVYNFIKFCRDLQVMEVIMFETEDLVGRKNEKHVVLTLLEVARRGAKLGMLAPMLVQFEQQIDIELAREEKERKKKEREQRERERQAREEERQREREERERKKKEKEEREEREREEREKRKEEENNPENDMFPSLAVEVHGDTGMDDLDDLEGEDEYEDDFEDLEDQEYEDEVEEEEEEEEEEGYPYPIGPLPQEIFNDLKSLDEMVRELVSECQCPTQFPMIRVSEGKYRIGDTKVLIFVRILRSHVMVRVGGGWDTLQNYLDKHDPCRCRRGHRSTTGAHLALRHNKSPMAAGVTYDRCESPGTPRRRSSAFTGSSRQGSFCSTTQEKPRAYSRQWETPRGSLAATGSLPRGHSAHSRSRSPSSASLAGGLGGLAGGVNPLLRGNSGTGSGKGLFIQDTPKSSKDCNFSAQHSESSSTKQRDPLLLCDSSSEVSDEGYKSSQGNVSKMERDLNQTPSPNNQLTSDGRPESSLTVGSDCSSTISTDDEEGVTISPSPVPPTTTSISPQLTSSSNVGDNSDNIDVDLSSGTIKTSSVRNSKNMDDEMGSPAAVANVKNQQATTSSTLSPATKNRLANLFKKIPKFKQQQQPTQQQNPPSRTVSNLTETIDHQNNHGSMSRRGTVADASKTPTASPRTPSMTRTRSASSENGFNRGTSERSSYRAPKGTSRYMQAAEAYKQKSVCGNSSISSGVSSTSTWSAASTTRSRPRASITADTFTPRAPRTASASPAVHRKRVNSLSSRDKPNGTATNMRTPSAGGAMNYSPSTYTVTSTHSTPSKKPMKRSQSRDYYSRTNSGSGGCAANFSGGGVGGEPETDEMILKRMEEILFTYKSKVEDRLAAEGKELPKDIFNDFTEHWLNSTPQRAKSIDTLSENSSIRSHERSPGDRKTPVLPKARKESREGCSSTRIPKPIFYKNSIS